MKQIILASTSEPKKRVLRQIGLKFRAVASNFEEETRLRFAPKVLAKRLALGKAKAVGCKYKNSIIIGADTFLVYKNKILGKAKSKNDAYKMLKMLNGKCHSIITGIVVVDTKKNKSISRVVETKVYFRKLKDKEIKEYLNSGEYKNRAGSYAIQGRGAILVKKIDGDYYSIMGMPVFELINILNKFGINIPN